VVSAGRLAGALRCVTLMPAAIKNVLKTLAKTHAEAEAEAMDSPTPTKFETDILTPVGEALDAARGGDLAAAMLRLKLDAAALPQAVFGVQVQALDRALDQVNRGQLILAAPDFATCSPLIEAVGVADIGDFLAILRDLATGYALRLRGDAAGALKLFETAMARADHLRFSYGNITLFYMQGKVGANLAQLTIAFSRGAIDEAEAYAGNVQETYSEMEQAMGAAGAVAPAAIVEALVPVIEAAVTFGNRQQHPGLRRSAAAPQSRV